MPSLRIIAHLVIANQSHGWNRLGVARTVWHQAWLCYRALPCTVCHSAGCRRYFLGGLFLLADAKPPHSTIPFRDRLNPIRRLDLAFVRLSTTTETIGLHGNHECPVSNVPLVGGLRTTIAFPSFFHFQFIIDIYLSQVSAKSRILYEIFHSST